MHIIILGFFPRIKLIRGIVKLVIHIKIIIATIVIAAIITAATSNVEYANYDDLLSNTSNKTQVVPSEPAYRVNRVTYDIEAHTVLVERIGQQTAALKSDTSKTRVRDRLLFNLDTMEVTHPNS